MSATLRPPSPIGPTTGPLAARLGAALTLRRDFYAQAAAESVATGPAGAVVCLVTLARESVVIYELSQVVQYWAIILPVLIVVALVSWVLLGAAAWLVTRVAAAPPGFTRLLRCLGFAQTPTMMLAALAAATDPTIYAILYFALMFWAYAAVVVALRAAAETSTDRAALFAVPVFLVEWLLLLLSRYAALG